MITLGHEFISPNETFPCADELLAESADHSTEVDSSHYAVVHGALPRLSNNALSQHRWLSEEWSSLLGLGPHPPPEPVRVIRTRARSTTSLDPTVLALKVADLVSNTLMGKLEAVGITPNLIANLAQQRPMQAVPPGHGSGNDTSSPVDPVSAPDWHAPPLPSPTLATTMHARSPSNFHALKALAAPRISHEPGRHKRPMCKIACTQESTRPKKRIRRPTSRSASREEWKSGSSGACGDSDSIKDFMTSSWDDSSEEASNQPSVQSDGDSVQDLLSYDSPPIVVDDWENTPKQSTSYKDAQGEMLVTRNVSQILVEEVTLRDNIRGAMKALLGNPAAREKSMAQMMGILIVMRRRQDAMITMRTGGGKSMLWQVPVLLNNELRFIVICPFTVLLEEQCVRAERAKIKAINYGQSRMIPPEVQILFVQVEHVSSRSFAE